MVSRADEGGLLDGAGSGVRPDEAGAERGKTGWMAACAAENVGVLVVSDPPMHCPACLAEAGASWPVGATSRHCAQHLEQLRRRQCRAWNADHAHQVMAGQATFAAFSARWRAEQGMAPLSAADARRYVRPVMIRSLGVPLPAEVQARIYRAWCCGYLYGVLRWTYEPAWAAQVDMALDRAQVGWDQSAFELGEIGE